MIKKTKSIQGRKSVGVVLDFSESNAELLGKKCILFGLQNYLYTIKISKYVKRITVGFDDDFFDNETNPCGHLGMIIEFKSRIRVSNNNLSWLRTIFPGPNGGTVLITNPQIRGDLKQKKLTVWLRSKYFNHYIWDEDDFMFFEPWLSQNPTFK